VAGADPSIRRPGPIRQPGVAVSADRGAPVAAQPHVAPGEALPAGLVPVAFAFARRRVRLLDLRGVDCRESELGKTVRRWSAEHPDMTPLDLDLDAFMAAAGRTPVPPPAGIIFNVARCGSTLLANMLAAPAGHLVVKESTTVGVLLREILIGEAKARGECEALLTVTLPLFGRAAGTPHAHVFVKPHSWATVTAGTVLRLFPDTPTIFLYREPAAVVASMLAKAPYGGLFDQPRAPLAPFFPSLLAAEAGLSPAAFHAHLWRSPVEAALALPAGRVLFLDYDDLVAHPEDVIRRTLGHLGIGPAPVTVAAMRDAMHLYAKDEGRQTPFDPDGAHRRPPLTAEQRADVAGVVGDLYTRLDARRRAQS
jgi:hypothetical protein